MAKKNLSADKSGKTISSTSAPQSCMNLDKHGKETPTVELTEEEKREKFGKCVHVHN